jgi:hypothetical protein
MSFLNDNAFRREFRDWGYMDVEFEAHGSLKKLKQRHDVGEKPCERDHECAVREVLEKFSKERASDRDNRALQRRDEFIGNQYPLLDIREYPNLTIKSKCSMNNSLLRVLGLQSELVAGKCALNAHPECAASTPHD